MAPPENYAPPGSINDASEFKRLALSLVGDRKYVRALELVSQLRQWFPQADLGFRFKRPLTCDVLVTKSHQAEWSTHVTVETEGKREELFIINVDSGRIYRTEERRKLPHVVLHFSEHEQRYLALGSDETSLLDLIFETYRERTGVRPIIVSMKLMSIPKRRLRYVTVKLDMVRTQWIKAKIFANSRHWADFSCIRG